MPERDDQAPCDLALKEWAVAVLAYATGQTICAVRKGGIHEKRFELPGRRCFLFPTYLHQAAETVQRRFHPALEHVTAHQPGDGVVHLRYLAEITDVLPLEAPERLEALEPHLIWTPAYVTQRFRWRPRQPLQLLLLRVSQLPEQHVLPMLAAYNGCSSWVTLGRPLSTAGAQPVMADARYADVRQSVLEAVDAVTVS
jgi:hypothetical protein